MTYPSPEAGPELDIKLYSPAREHLGELKIVEQLHSKC